jgi:nicotinate-nucleotide--dimethylbenzimidazole phosphoribosyltransferase
MGFFFISNQEDAMLYEKLKQIKSLENERLQSTRNRVDQLIKPQGSLGKIEEIAIKLSGITGQAMPRLDRHAIIVMCADHGVCDEGIASAPQVVTLLQTLNISKRITGVGALADPHKTKIYTVDIGVNSKIEDPAIYARKIRMGTGNISRGPAMSRSEAIKAIEVGIEMAEMAINEGAKILGTGEMGIGNTTPSTAILSILTGTSPYEITGVGANYPTEKLEYKASVIERAISVNAPNASDPLEILSKVGGLDIAGMAGVMIGGAASRVPVVVDGFISTISALIACALEPNVKSYLFASHASHEKGAKLASTTLGLEPFLNLEMRLGEGSGAALAFSILEAACRMNSDMITFEESGIGVV